MAASKKKKREKCRDLREWIADLEEEAQYGNKRFPPWASEISADMVELVQKKWKKYGF